LRKLIIAATLIAPLALAAAPAAAQSGPDPRDEAIVRALPDRHEVERLGDTLGRVAEALMDVDVGPIVDAARGRAHSPRHRETLGDLATRDDPYARERIRDQVGMATVGVGAAAEQLAVLTPVLRRSLEDAARSVEDAIDRGRIRDDRRYDPDLDHERDEPRPD
jgi:hypothetical protein